MSHSILRKLLLLASFAALPACAGTDTLGDIEEVEQHDDRFTSAQAALVTLDWDGELTAPWQSNTTKLVKDQLFYTLGQLNVNRSVGRFDQVVITNIKTSTNAGDGWMKVTYHASLPVGWGSKTEIPATTNLIFPRRIGPQSLANFATKYGPTCSDAPSEVTSGNYWFHYRPAQAGCVLTEADVTRATAKVTKSANNTTGKFPEYDLIWKDGAFRAVAVFGKYEDYATANSDAGIEAYNAFVDTMKAGFGAGLTTTPAAVPASPGVAMTDVTFSGKINGRTVSVTALLIDSPKLSNPTFEKRYAALTATADLVTYNGHAGLGANVKALASKGWFVKDQYVVFLMNGCDTFAYLDNTLANRFAKMNPNDPTGTKHLDMLVNLMPAYFQSMPDAVLELVTALADPDRPRTYEQIFSGIDAQQVVVAVGEEDNAYIPKAQPFDGYWASGLLDRDGTHRYDTGLLPAGTYTIRIRETNAGAKGDVDLYVGIGYAPTDAAYDYRPYLYGSDESVQITLTKPSVVHVMLHAYEDGPAQSGYALDVQ